MRRMVSIKRAGDITIGRAVLELEQEVVGDEDCRDVTIGPGEYAVSFLSS
jgi:hypothetical protein